MNVTTTEQPPREAVLTIQLEPSEVEPFLERSYRRVVQRTNIPGFRKGKAPRQIVERLLGRDFLLSEALEFMVPEITNKAVAEASLEVGGIPSVNVAELDPPNIVATVPLSPTIDLGSYAELRVPRPEIQVAAEQVDEEVERVRWAVAPWEPVEEPVALDDLLNVSVKGWADGKQFVNTDRADFIPRADSRVPAPGFAEALVGMNAHESKEISVDVPPDFEYPEVAGKSCKFDVTVHIVKRKKPVELNDDFAKGVGSGYESLADMKSKIEAEFAQNEERAVKSKHEEDTLEKLLEGATFVMSPLIVDHELEHLLEDHQEALRTGRMNVEQYRQYLSWAGKSADEIREAARPEAEGRIKRALVLQKVASEHTLTVADEELDAEVERMAKDSSSEADQFRDLFKDAERRDSLRRMLVSRKALEFLSNMAAGGPSSANEATPAGKPAKAARKQQSRKPKQETKEGVS